ncbi:MAG: mercury(II) reductase [Anaerolineae bacterium]|nr:mercury(II) reductase [Anaerolineae bacterium]
MSEKQTEQRMELEVRGMTCDACALHVTRALQGVEGVLQVNVPGWTSGQAFLSAQPDVDEAQLVNAVEQAGYRASLRTPAAAARTEPLAETAERDADFDLIVIGTGGGGMAAAIKAAELGRRAAIIEAGVLGGTCVNIGCVPSKALIRAAEAYHQAGHHPFGGVQTRAESLDWPAVIGQKDHLVGELRQGKYEDVLASYGERITLIRGRARLLPDGAVALDNGRTIAAARIVVASGAAPRILPLDGIGEVEVLTSTSAMALEALPRSMVVIGGRAVALELGQAFARFGTQVTLLQRSPRLIPDHESEIAEALADYLHEEGLAVHTGVRPLAIRQEAEEKVITADVGGERRQFRAEQVLMAVGRTPRTSEMGLEEAGVALDADGFIVVNEFMQTSNPRIYAAGDVTQNPKLVYVAAAGGGIAAENALEGNRKRLDLAALPDVIFTDPQVASVGLTEKQALARGYDVKATVLPLAYVPRALAARDTRGLIKLVADRNSDRLLGAHVLAAEAGEVIQTAALAMRMGLRYGFTVTDLREMLFPYLVQVEGLKLAAQTFEKDVTKLSCCAS